MLADIAEDALWVIDHEDFYLEFLAKRRRVQAYVKDIGAVNTERGVVDIKSTGWDWNEEEVAKIDPNLVIERVLIVAGPPGDTMDEVEDGLRKTHGVTVEAHVKIDKTQAGTAAKFVSGGNSRGDKIAAARQPKGAQLVLLERGKKSSQIKNESAVSEWDSL